MKKYLFSMAASTAKSRVDRHKEREIDWVLGLAPRKFLVSHLPKKFTKFQTSERPSENALLQHRIKFVLIIIDLTANYIRRNGYFAQ